MKNQFSCVICNKSFNSSRKLAQHIHPKHKITLRLYYDKYLLQNNENKCVICGKETVFDGLKLGYRKHCSIICVGLNSKIRDKVKNTLLQNYGVDNPSKSAIIQGKKKKTNMERYGVKWYSNPNKAKITNIKKYGVDNYLNSPEGIRRKTKTWNEKYGVSHPLLSKEVRQKIKVTCIKKYGFDNPTKNKNIANKVRQSMIARIESGEGQTAPNYNPNACKIIDWYNMYYDFNFQHAKNGGEYHVPGTRFWVDGYDKDKNVVIEYYEKWHIRQIKKDEQRKQEIIDFLECEFIEIKEWKII